MSEQGGIPIQSQVEQTEIKKQFEPIGVRIIGQVDPRGLIREQFEASPDCLYHGAARPFVYVHRYDYQSSEYDTDGSQTLGEGFYTTNLREAAENYSRIRQPNDKANPIVMTLLPYQARVLDLRAVHNPSQNAPVPAGLFHKWYEHYKSYFLNQVRANIPVKSVASKYWSFLDRAKQYVDSGEHIDLRVMLCTALCPKLQAYNWPHPCYMKLFSNFMVSEGYDGLVYIEGGEGAKAQNHPSSISYNLEKIGTYNNWQSRD